MWLIFHLKPALRISNGFNFRKQEATPLSNIMCVGVKNWFSQGLAWLHQVCPAAEPHKYSCQEQRLRQELDKVAEEDWWVACGGFKYLWGVRHWKWRFAHHQMISNGQKQINCWAFPIFSDFPTISTELNPLTTGSTPSRVRVNAADLTEGRCWVSLCGMILQDSPSSHHVHSGAKETDSKGHWCYLLLSYPWRPPYPQSCDVQVRSRFDGRQDTNVGCWMLLVKYN